MASFTGFPSDIKKLIYNHGDLPPDSLVRFSCANKETQKTLNEQFFAQFFHKQHPILKSFCEKAFKEIKLLMPSQFWKVSCSALAGKDIQSLPLSLIAKECIPVARQKLEECRLQEDKKLSEFSLCQQAFEQATIEYCVFLDDLKAKNTTDQQWTDLNKDKIKDFLGSITNLQSKSMKDTIEFLNSHDLAVRPFVKYIVLKANFQMARSINGTSHIFLFASKILQEIDQNPNSINESCLKLVKSVFTVAKKMNADRKISTL